MPGLILAAVNPDNTPHGYNWTFAFPMLLFAVVAVVLYALFSRPHRRVPGRPVASTATGAVPDAEIAHAAASAGGLSLAPDGGTAEPHPEPAGALLVADEPSAGAGPQESPPAGDAADAVAADGPAQQEGTEDSQ